MGAEFALIHLKPYPYPYLIKMGKKIAELGPSPGSQIHDYPDVPWLGQIPFKDAHKVGGFKFLLLSA